MASLTILARSLREVAQDSFGVYRRAVLELALAMARLAVDVVGVVLAELTVGALGAALELLLELLVVGAQRGST